MRPAAGGRIKRVKDWSRVDLSCFDFVAPRAQPRLAPQFCEAKTKVVPAYGTRTMSIENMFPPVPITEAPVPDESDHVLAFGCVDLGYAYVRDTKENVRRRSSRRSSVDVEAPSGAAAEGVV